MKPIRLLLIASMFSLLACESEPPTGTGGTESSSAPPAAKAVQPAEKPPVASTEKPVTGQLAQTPSSKTANAPMSGEQVYHKHCGNCHASGVANAPKLGDAAAWKSRLAKGENALYAAAKNGVPGTAMMAKGTCASCSDAQLNAAVDYMLSNSR